ncbi:Hypothetical predicted protein [Pelobates cultripes]|uniref:Uncharacterized protein n=1 Tax=Pelobates cultripes TaxID=61616 RepID=A0AAD1W7T0_PELCU|nr:Hypothetical predicted protein [Pelobates cultripes]
MAAEPDPKTGSNSSAMSLEDHGEYQRPQPQHAQQVVSDDLAPATKRDIRQLLKEMKLIFDSNLVWTEIQAVTTRVQATEYDLMDIRQEDITRNTLQWRKSLVQLTTQLCNEKVEYRWLLPRTLAATRDNVVRKPHYQRFRPSSNCWASAGGYDPFNATTTTHFGP